MTKKKEETKITKNARVLSVNKNDDENNIVTTLAKKNRNERLTNEVSDVRKCGNDIKCGTNEKIVGREGERRY